MKTIRIIAMAVAAIMVIATMLPITATAAPVRRQPLTVTQPDGSTLTLLPHGDEWNHWLTDAEGNLMLRDTDGYYRIATEAQRIAWQASVDERMQLRAEANARRAQKLQARHARQLTGTEGTEEDNAEGDNDALGSHFGFPVQGQIHGLVVLVQYQDVAFTIEEPQQVYADMMMKPGFDYAVSSKYVHHGSAHDYFLQNSMGKFDPQFDVYGPLTLKHNRSYYGNNNDRHAWEMIVEACEQLDSLGVDFSIYDNNQDGVIDFVFAFYAGLGQNNNVSRDELVWPHAWDMTSQGEGGKHVFDDVKLEDYACTCELYKDKLDGVGTFVHEFSHVLGLPDIYDVNYNACAPYGYDVLDAGCYALNGYCPVGYSAYERYELGWFNPVLLSEATVAPLPDFGTSNQAYVIPVTPDSLVNDIRDGEYYLIENRQFTGWDQYLPGHGMLLWHIDYVPNKWYQNTVNTWTAHQCIDLVEADGPKNRNGFYAPDESSTFPGTANHTSLTDDTTPALSGWSSPGNSGSSLGNRLNKAITNIQEIIENPDDEESLAVITFDYREGTESLKRIEQDAAQRKSGIVLLNDKLIIHTANGNYDTMGRRIQNLR